MVSEPVEDGQGTRKPPVRSVARPVGALLLAVLPAPLLWWSALAWQGRLPDPLPTHWTSLSTPDGFTSYGSTWHLLVVVAVVGAALGVVALVLSRVGSLADRATFVVGSGLAWGALGTWAAMVLAAWGRSDAHSAPLQWRVVLPIVLGLGGAWLVLPTVGARPRTRHLLPRPGSVSPLVLDPGERAVWEHRMFLVWPLLLAAPMAVVGVVLGFVADVLTGAVLVAAGAVVAVFAWVQVGVDERGLRVGVGPWGWTVKKIALGAIAEVGAESIRATDWGGWGYRVMPGRSALVLRSGPAIVVDLDDGRRFAVTVDDPQPAVDLLEAMRARSAR